MSVSPFTLNIGSGLRKGYPKGNWNSEWINMDIDPLTDADWIADISNIEFGEKIHFERLGIDLTIEKHMFDSIVCKNVFQFIDDLPSAYKNIIDLINFTGKLTVTVPFEYSRNAWANPKTLRTFNEDSWKFLSIYSESIGIPFDTIHCNKVLYFIDTEVLTEYWNISQEEIKNNKNQIFTLPRVITDIQMEFSKCKEHDVPINEFYFILND